MGWFSSLGSKLSGFARKVFQGGKQALKTGLSIGNKVLNSDIADTVLKVATPFLSAHPIGRGILTGVQGARTALQVGDRLVNTVEAGERLVNTIKDDGFSIPSLVGGALEIGTNLQDLHQSFK